MNTSIRGLEVFRAVMHTGSVSKAAYDLNISQPTASGILKRFESSIGIPLFNRVSFGLTPTPEAIQLLTEIERIFSHLEHINVKIKNIAEGGNAFLSVQSIPSMSKHFVAPTIKLFNDLIPKSRMSIHSAQSSQVINNIEIGAFDVGFVYGMKTSLTINYTPLKKIKFECIMHKNNKLAKKEIINADDLLAENIILNRAGTDLRNSVDKELDKYDLKIIPKIGTGTIQAYDLIDQEIAIGILDSSLLTPSNYPELVSRPTFMNIEVEACLIYNKLAPLSIFAKQYIEMVKAFFKPDYKISQDLFEKESYKRLRQLLSGS